MSGKISIIVPVYKVEPYLDRCIDSIVNQTFTDIEIILVDDGSPDNCPEMCDKWAAKDPRIIVIHKKNGGLSDARNKGINRASGEYLLFVDSDDYIELEACERLIAYADDVDLIVGEATIHEDGKLINRIHTNLRENYVYSGEECAREEIKVGEWFAAACYNMYRKDFLTENHLFFKEGILHEDNEYLPRLFLAAKTVKYIHYQFYHYMIHKSSICGSKSDKHLKDLFETYSSTRKLIDTIHDDATKKAFAGALVKSFMFTTREYHVKEDIFPEGIDKKYMVRNALNARELIKVLVFCVFRKLYVML